MRRFFGPTGSVSRDAIESQALKNNMLGDPSVRTVDVYVPAGHDGQGLPLLVDLVGFTGSGLSHTNWVGFRENLPERLDRLIGEQRMPPVVVAVAVPCRVLWGWLGSFHVTPRLVMAGLALGIAGSIDETPCECGLPGRRIRLDGLP